MFVHSQPGTMRGPIAAQHASCHNRLARPLRTQRSHSFRTESAWSSSASSSSSSYHAAEHAPYRLCQQQQAGQQQSVQQYLHQKQQEQQQRPSSSGSLVLPGLCQGLVLQTAQRLRSCAAKAAVWVQQQQQLTASLGSASALRQPGGLLAAALLVPTLPGGGVADLFTNRVFMAGFAGWAVAQCLKIFTRYTKSGKWDLRALVDSGGMPSSHSALCAGITTSIALQQGFGSTAFAVSFAFSCIVMYDAAGVRRHAGKQAEVLNQVIGELLEGHPVSAVKLKEVLGHTPLQVYAGAFLGVLFGMFYPMPIVVTA